LEQKNNAYYEDIALIIAHQIKSLPLSINFTIIVK